MREFEVKTMLSEGHYKMMAKALKANGMTQAGFVRHLILRYLYESQDYVVQMNAAERAETERAG